MVPRVLLPLVGDPGGAGAGGTLLSAVVALWALLDRWERAGAAESFKLAELEEGIPRKSRAGPVIKGTVVVFSSREPRAFRGPPRLASQGFRT